MLKNHDRAAAKPTWPWRKNRRALRRNCAVPSTVSKAASTSRASARAALEALAAGAVHFSLPAGDVLFESGSPPEGVYLLASGRLGVRVGGSRRRAEIARGELVGEAGWLLGEPRSATVTALRDSELVLLPHAVARGRRGQLAANSRSPWRSSAPGGCGAATRSRGTSPPQPRIRPRAEQR